jgi:hypothetical protein
MGATSVENVSSVHVTGSHRLFRIGTGKHGTVHLRYDLVGDHYRHSKLTSGEY